MNITAAELKDKLNGQEEVNIIDVREELEYHTFNVGGENIPLGRLRQVLEDLDLNKADEIIVICQRGIRSATGQRILETAGFQNVRNLEGGLLAFRKVKETE